MIDKLNFNEKSLIPTIIQDEDSGKVLTLCYMNKEALMRTLGEGKIYVYRRSLCRIALKGERSGHVQEVKKVYVDCANNSLLFKVKQNVGACHEGYFTCFFREIDEKGNEKITEKRVFDPKDVY